MTKQELIKKQKRRVAYASETLRVDLHILESLTGSAHNYFNMNYHIDELNMLLKKLSENIPHYSFDGEEE